MNPMAVLVIITLTGRITAGMFLPKDKDDEPADNSALHDIKYKLQSKIYG